MSPNTERAYRLALASSSLLEGPLDALPDLDVLRRAVELLLPPKPMPQHESTVVEWTERVTKMLEEGATPTAIYDCLRLQEPKFAGSLSAIKRLCQRIKRDERRELTTSRSRSTPSPATSRRWTSAASVSPS